MCHSLGLSDEVVSREVLFHKTCSGHPNIIKLLDFGTDRNWLYIAMELATGGDLFDKIEPDIGVDEEISHFYFKQLINSIDFIHSKGIAHRDIKPENILLDAQGNLKIADFGLAAVFRKSRAGEKRLCYTPCGSAPYMAPELVSGNGYDPEYADIWSCGIVLFVLLSGETPWEEPTKADPFFRHFSANDGKILTEPWNKFSPMVLSLLRLILKISVDKRGKIDQLRKHIWVNQENKYSTPDGLCKDSTLLTSKLLENMHIGLSDEQYVQSSNSEDQYDSIQDHFIASQPVADIAAMIDDAEDDQFSRLISTQQEFTDYNKAQIASKQDSERESIFKIISKDPSVLQFSKNKKLSGSQAPHFNYADRLTRFFSILPAESLIPILISALHRIGISTAGFQDKIINDHSLNKGPVHITVHTVDRRKSFLRGNIKISRVENLKLKTVDFVKTKGDPLEWRRLFKRITILSREAVYIEE
ncbi:Serine/threonine-protein kinase [Wickerhamomyces ciferrii]|uniref:non-specific serine/threonine protein kinase n=1 Tax=Wickerhamomyces ciferrii (strain ATCC 14091 / BCRC 22168 / CBS 111 / JCM 3599 / NBRC 0793 / NRRL Y-1031 F-60-10) TaxID=1206466 RepID=K0KHK5_WICCF|nr:Serine/threonine-protein kinase [Wickerhamomyces ciferrii]CCH40648.1 Serine/threonine-protein kinase [Wickerhamomyces ciferrii]